MKSRHLYLLLAVIGVILPYTRLIPFLQVNGMDMVLLFQSVFTSGHAVAFFGMDLMVTAVAAVFFIVLEGRHKKIPLWWTAIIGLFLVGVSFALPWFLFLRERRLSSQEKDPASP